MLQRFAKFLEVREATDEEVETAFQPDELAGSDGGHMIKGSSMEQYPPSSSNLKRDQTQLGSEKQQQFCDVEETRNNFVNMLHISKQSVQPTIETPMKSVKLPFASAGLGSGLSAHPQPNVTFAMNKDNNTKADADEILTEVSLESNNDKNDDHLDVEYAGDGSNEIEQSKKLQERNHNALYLNEDLLSAIAEPNAHFTNDLDEQIKAWALSSLNNHALGSTSIQPERKGFHVNNNSIYGEYDASSSVSKIKELNDQVNDLQNRLNHAEKVSAEMEAAVLFTQEEFVKQIRELESTIKELEFRASVAEAKSLSIEVLKNRRTDSESNGSTTTSNADDFLKHCAKLKRRLDSFTDSNETAMKDAEASRIAGQRLAVLGAKVAASEQQIKDEKLVLKNLFLSWVERGERKDAFEILARAFEFTPEDRQRLEPKPSWQRGAALGAKWSLSESLADFVRDETS